MITVQLLLSRLQNEHGIALDPSDAYQIIDTYYAVSKEMKKSDKELVKNSSTLREKGEGFTDKDVALMKSHKLSDIYNITRDAPSNYSYPMTIKFFDGTSVVISGRNGNCCEFRGDTAAKAIQQQFESNPSQTLLETLAKPMKDLNTNDMILYSFTAVAGNLNSLNQADVDSEEIDIEPVITAEKLKNIVLQILAEETEAEETERKKLSYKIKSAIAFMSQSFKFLGNKIISAVASILQPFKSLLNKIFGAKKANPNSEPAVSIAPLHAVDLQAACDNTGDNESVTSPSVARSEDLGKEYDSDNDDSFESASRSSSLSPSG